MNKYLLLILIFTLCGNIEASEIDNELSEKISVSHTISLNEEEEFNTISVEEEVISVENEEK